MSANKENIRPESSSSENDLSSNDSSWNQPGTSYKTDAQLRELAGEGVIDLPTGCYPPTFNIAEAYGLTNQSSMPQPTISPEPRKVNRQLLALVSQFEGYYCYDGSPVAPCGITCGKNGEILVGILSHSVLRVFTKEHHLKNELNFWNSQGPEHHLYPNCVTVERDTNSIMLAQRYPYSGVHVCDGEGDGESDTVIRSFGSDVLRYPRGIAVDQLHQIVVLDSYHKKVFVFNEQGQILHEINCSSMEFPNGVAVNEKQEIFISDLEASCVKVFSYNGEFLRKFGEKGVTTNPIGVAINPDGLVFVGGESSSTGFKVTMFSQDGDLVAAFETSDQYDFKATNFAPYGKMGIVVVDNKATVYHFMFLIVPDFNKAK